MRWFAIRNASDPQIPNPTNDIHAAEQEAGQIYSRMELSRRPRAVIAAWAVIKEATQ